jgi:hypothetical protein
MGTAAPRLWGSRNQGLLCPISPQTGSNIAQVHFRTFESYIVLTCGLGAVQGLYNADNKLYNAACAHHDPEQPSGRRTHSKSNIGPIGGYSDLLVPLSRGLRGGVTCTTMNFTARNLGGTGIYQQGHGQGPHNQFRLAVYIVSNAQS